jgi:hypothetical protein
MKKNKSVPKQLSLFDMAPSPNSADAKSRFSDYVVFVDESGDHGMQTLDQSYPLFVLAFCVFHKRHYNEKVVVALQQFKFKHFGHDLVVLHEHEIRKEKGEFTFFQNKQHKNEFLAEITNIIDSSNFVLITSVIDKASLRRKPGSIPNPYHLALGFCLETLYEFLKEKRQGSKLTHVVVECRGKKEDNELELEFRRICSNANRFNAPLPFEVIFADKKVNSCGLQLADLVARPVGLSVLRPGQSNRAFDTLTRKFFCRGGRSNAGHDFENWGLKIYPTPESEKPR